MMATAEVLPQIEAQILAADVERTCAGWPCPGPGYKAKQVHAYDESFRWSYNNSVHVHKE